MTTLATMRYTFEVYDRKALRNAAFKASMEGDDSLTKWDWARQRRESGNTIQFDIDTLISFDTYSAGLKFRDADSDVIEFQA